MALVDSVRCPPAALTPAALTAAALTPATLARAQDLTCLRSSYNGTRSFSGAMHELDWTILDHDTVGVVATRSAVVGPTLVGRCA